MQFEILVSGTNLDLLCISQLDAAPIFENYAELYFDATPRKGIECEVVKFLVPLFSKKVSFLANIGCCPNFLD